MTITRSPQPKLARDQPSISTAYPLLLLDIVAEQGQDPQKVLTAAGVSKALVHQPDGHISPRDYTALTLAAMHITGDTGLGCELGLRMRPSSHGFLGYAVMTARTLREAIDVSLRFTGLRQQGIGLRFEEVGDTARVYLDACAPMGPAGPQFMEGMLIGWASGLRWLVGDPHVPMVLSFVHPRLSHHDRFADRLPPCRFDQAVTCLQWPARYLNQPLVMTDLTASQLAVRQCEQELERLLPQAGMSMALVQRIQALLARDLAETPKLPQVAQQLCLSERTLKRRLMEQGWHFQQLVDQVRHEHARAWLHDARRSIEDIALQLGYRDPANFTRAFRRWQGCSPTRYRETLLAISATVKSDQVV